MNTTQTLPAHDFSVYRYFDRSFYGELLLFLLFGPALIIVWFTNIYAYQISGVFFGPLSRSAIYLTVTCATTLLFYRNFRKRLRSRGLVVEKERIVKKTTRGISVINFAEVTGFYHFNVPVIKGWLVLNSETSSFYIPLFVNKAEEMISETFRRLEENGIFLENANLFKEELSRKTLLTGQKRQRRFYTLKGLLYSLTATALLGTATAVVFWDQPLFIGLLFGTASMSFPLIAYFIIDSLLTLKQSHAPEKKLSYTNDYLLTGLISLLLYMIAAFSFRNIYF